MRGFFLLEVITRIIPFGGRSFFIFPPFIPSLADIITKHTRLKMALKRIGLKPFIDFWGSVKYLRFISYIAICFKVTMAQNCLTVFSLGLIVVVAPCLVLKRSRVWIPSRLLGLFQSSHIEQVIEQVPCWGAPLDIILRNSLGAWGTIQLNPHTISKKICLVLFIAHNDKSKRIRMTIPQAKLLHHGDFFSCSPLQSPPF